MNEGHVVQIGTPRQIYEQPANQFVADFVGTTNFIAGTVTALDAARPLCRQLGDRRAQGACRRRRSPRTAP